MKILIADKFEKAGIEGLKKLGCEVACEPDLGADGIPAALERLQPQILVVRSTKVPTAVIAKADTVKVIIRAGAGVDNIDVAAATAKGIKVCNCPGMNSIAVAELTMGLLLACDRRIPDQTIDARAGKWNKKEYGSKARGLKGSTLGVIGAGAIGRAVIKRARAFEMRVLAWSHGITKEHVSDIGAEFGGNDNESLLELAETCDAVTIHIPLAPETKHLIGKKFFDHMKPGAYIINTSRGGVIDEAALREAIKTKGIRAGLDVFEESCAASEGPWQSQTAQFGPGVYCTHHVGASTSQAQDAIAEEVVRMVHMYKSRNRIENSVN